MMSFTIINRPSKSVMTLLKNRIHDKGIKDWLADGSIEAVGLIQGPLGSIIAAMDVAEKTADVEVAEINGTCPQHIVLVAIMGDTAAVNASMESVKQLS
ncbi:BMC domain-containing protein [Lacrimispora sp.]|uniref:BMC domain-containing protein n=1 Tax=Lacrimispora sp. TaxID=2719234 RepID=UPI0028ABB858|nr:BMC domain-containing protein [Lacrimispora sp.]